MTESPNPVADILIRARALIEPPGAWTQRLYARTAKGKPCSPTSRLAACWCPVGAIVVAAARLGYIRHTRQFWRAVTQLEEAVGSAPIYWADAPNRTHAQILAGFDAAIERAKAAGDAT
jgi:hypothetical protein